MSRVLEPAIPPALRRELDRDDNEGFTLALLTVTEQGFPHQALISVGEVVVLDERNVRLALWPAGTTTGNLIRTRRCALAAVAGGVAYTVSLALVPRGELHVHAGALAVVDGRVVEVLADTAPYAVLESGHRFRLTDPAGAIARWARTRRAMRDLGAPAAGA